MLRHDFSHVVDVAKGDLDVCGVLFFNVADVDFECCEIPSPWCMQYGLMLRRDFFLLFFFSVTVAHLMSTVDLTALRPSGGRRPSGRPGASNAHNYLNLDMNKSEFVHTLPNVKPLHCLPHALAQLGAFPHHSRGTAPVGSYSFARCENVVLPTFSKAPCVHVCF
jgi:hypothetical protein